MFGLIFSATFVWNISSLYEEVSEIWSEVRVGSSCKVPFVIVRFYSNLFSLQISEKKIIEIPNFMNICLVGAALFHADRQTDVTSHFS